MWVRYCQQQRLQQRQRRKTNTTQDIRLLRPAYVTRYMSNWVDDIHFLVAPSSLTRPVSPVGGLYSGKGLVMWSTVCSGAPHPQATLSVRPHDHMDELNLPKPILRRFNIVHSLRGSTSPFTCLEGELRWRWSLDRSADCHYAVQEFFNQLHFGYAYRTLKQPYDVNIVVFGNDWNRQNHQHNQHITFDNTI